MATLYKRIPLEVNLKYRGFWIIYLKSKLEDKEDDSVW